MWSVYACGFFFLQADLDPEVGSVQPKKRTFKKFTFRGVDLDALLDMSSDELVELFHARARRRFVLYTCTTVENVFCAFGFCHY